MSLAEKERNKITPNKEPWISTDMAKIHPKDFRDCPPRVKFLLMRNLCYLRYFIRLGERNKGYYSRNNATHQANQWKTIEVTWFPFLALALVNSIITLLNGVKTGTIYM